MKNKQSRFWQSLWANYSKAPSIALCRVPELELASSLNVHSMFLDHCCGNGTFASIAWDKNSISAGCDISDGSIAVARKLGIYERLDICDASKTLPYDTASFDFAFNNSALEHIYDLDTTLKEVARILKPNGEFAFNVLNHRYFNWWPLSEDSMRAYRNWQPFYHALSISEWTEQLAKASLKVVNFQGYFDRTASRRFAKLDYQFSGTFIKNLSFKYVNFYLRFEKVMSIILKKQLGNIEWGTGPDSGAGYFIRAVKIQ